MTDENEVKASVDQFPKQLIAPKIGDDGTGISYYEQGEVKFPIDLTSLGKTVDTVGALSRPILDKLAVSNGFELNDMLSDSALLDIVGGCIQNEWYLKVRGEIPTGVIRHHVDRIRRYQKLVVLARENPDRFTEDRMKKKKEGKVSKSDLKANRVFVAFKKNLELVGRGQATQIYEALIDKDGGATAAQLTSAVKSKVKLNPRFKATLESCVRSHLNTFVKQGLVQIKGEPIPTPKVKAKPKKEPKAKKEPKPKKAPKTPKAKKEPKAKAPKAPKPKKAPKVKKAEESQAKFDQAMESTGADKKPEEVIDTPAPEQG